MAIHSIVALTVVALFKLGDAQEFPIILCAEPFSTTSNGHLLANVNNKGSVGLKWEKTQDNFIVTIRQNSVNFKGDLKPKTGSNKDKILSVDLTFRSKRDIDDCYCSSQRFLDQVNGRTFDNPRYTVVEKLCSRNLLENPETNPDGLLFCPKCENDQCDEGRRTRDSPSPVYSDWQFYTQTEGGLSGEGLEVFRRQLRDNFPVDPSVTTCTPVIDNLPLAQFGCNNLLNPDAGFGYGVNGKNQKCGFATWFNCEEDLPSLGRDGEMFKSHTADLNLNIVPCPPTVAPTPYPTDTPYPTASPTPHCEYIEKELEEHNCPEWVEE